MRSKVLLLVLAVCLSSFPAMATTVVSTAGVTATPPDNCGFIPSGTGWVRLHLKNDSGAGRDFWVRDGQYYPLRVLDILLPTDAQAPSSVSIDDSQTCGYTRSYGLDECNAPGYTEGYIVNAGGIPSNVGFISTADGLIDVKLRSEGTSGAWHTYNTVAGEFLLGDIIDCQLSTSAGPTYLTAVAP